MMKPDDPRRLASRVYNIRGLLGPKLDIEQLSKLISGNISIEPIKTLDRNRFVVQATVSEEQALNRFLASLSKPAKW